jgi:hypothetical protein
LFWDFVDHLTSLEEKHIHGSSQEEHYDFISMTAEKFLPEQQSRLFHFAMSIRAHSPTVEMNGQVGRYSQMSLNS